MPYDAEATRRGLCIRTRERKRARRGARSSVWSWWYGAGSVAALLIASSVSACARGAAERWRAAQAGAATVGEYWPS